MKQVKTEAVILDSLEIFDADRSFLLFTEELGKVRARARGVRKPTSRLTGHLLQYLPVHIELLEGRSGYLITQAQVVSDTEREGVYPTDSLLFLHQAGILAEAINRFFIEDEAHPAIYAGLVYSLQRLYALCQNGARSKAELVVAELLLKCLAELGYHPQLDNCGVTDEPISEEFVGWNSQIGGVLSRTGYEKNREGSLIVQAPRAIIGLRMFLQPQFMAERLAMSEEVGQQLISLIYDYVQTQIGQPLRGLKVNYSHIGGHFE